MSAIFGIFSCEGNAGIRQDILAHMAARTRARGTEKPLFWHAPDAPLSLCIRALTTTDLTPDGRQPGTAKDSRIAVMLDGYIGNAAVLRRELEQEGIRLRGHGDAELLAASSAHYGLNRLLQKLEGAFAFALWDGAAGALHLVRDRMGIKPLFVTRAGPYTAFASDPAAFMALPGYTPALDPEAVQEYLSLGYVTSPKTLLKDVQSIPPASRMMGQASDTALPAAEAWWRPATALEEIALRGAADKSPSKADRLHNQLATEAARADTAIAILDTGMAEASRLQAALEHEADKTVKNISLTPPDAIEIQTVFDTLSRASLPFANPAACLLWHTLKNADDITGVVLNAWPVKTPDNGDTTAKTKAWPKPVRKLAAALLPQKFGHLGLDAQTTFKTRNTLWQGLFAGKFAPVLTSPRMDMPEADLAAYFDFCGPCRERDIPLLDTMAGSHNLELRLPWTDQRLLEFYIPAPMTLETDLGHWLRGPLRIRVQNTLSDMYFNAFKICNKQLLQDSWQKLLAGDDTQAKKIWAYLTLAAWAGNNKLL